MPPVQKPRVYSSARAARRSQALGRILASCFAQLRKLQIGAAGDEPRQIGAQRADRRRDRHVVVVEDDDQARVHGAGIVHRLIGHAGAHGAVADHADDVVLLAGEIARHRHAEAGRDRGRGVRRAERVVFALGALGEAGQAAALAQGADAVAPAGQDLVRIGLVADIPDQPVARRVEDLMQRDGQLDHAEPGAEMAAGHRHRVDRLLAQLVRELAQVLSGSARKSAGVSTRSSSGVWAVRRSSSNPCWEQRRIWLPDLS